MWRIETDNGLVITEAEMLWPDLPPDIVIRNLACGPVHMRGYDAYGFQRFKVNSVQGGHVLEAGAQLIGVKGDRVEVIETGDKGTMRRIIPRSELTYSPALLRHGAR